MSERVLDLTSDDVVAAFLDGEPVVAEAVLLALHARLCRFGIAKFPNVPADEVKSLVNVTLAELWRNRLKYDPTRSALETYATNLLKFRVISYLRAAAARPTLELLSEHAREEASPGAYKGEESKNVKAMMKRQFYADVESRLDAPERALFARLREGEDRAAVLAPLIDLPLGDPEEAARAVQNARARLVRKVRAIAAELGYESADDLF